MHQQLSLFSTKNVRDPRFQDPAFIEALKKKNHAFFNIIHKIFMENLTEWTNVDNQKLYQIDIMIKLLSFDLFLPKSTWEAKGLG